MTAATTDGWLTTAQAARLAGVRLTTVHQACLAGTLRSTQETTGRRRRFIDPADLAEWRNVTAIRGPQTRTEWSEADREALYELNASCSAEQIAAYLGKTPSAVRNARHKLRDALPPTPTNKVPFLMPRSGILIAKTCSQCGRMRDAGCFRTRQKDGRSYSDPACKVCANDYRRARGYRVSPEAPSVVNYQLLQDVTRPQAFNEYRQYSSTDRDLLRDLTIDDLEAAFRLNRTYGAVLTQRSTMGLRPKQRLTSGHWAIDFPNAARAARDYYRALGGPVPESLWEWTDSECVA